MKTTLSIITLSILIALPTFAASKNYKAIYDNTDGSQAIEKPQFTSPANTGPLPLSTASDPDGVCKLYGKGSFVRNSLVVGGTVSNMVALDNSGQFNRFESGTEISYISCHTKNPAGTYPGIKTLNDDGSTTLSDLSFVINHSTYKLSTNNDFNVVCKLHGLTTYVANSLTKVRLCPTCTGTTLNSVKLDASGKFSEFVKEFEPVDNNGVQTIICR